MIKKIRSPFLLSLCLLLTCNTSLIHGSTLSNSASWGCKNLLKVGLVLYGMTGCSNGAIGNPSYQVLGQNVIPDCGVSVASNDEENAFVLSRTEFDSKDAMLISSFDSEAHLQDTYLIADGTDGLNPVFIKNAEDGEHYYFGLDREYGESSKPIDVLIGKGSFSNMSDIPWVISLNGTQDDFLEAAVIVSGGLNVALETRSHGVEKSAVQISQISEEGNVVWTVIIDGEEIDIPFSLQNIPNGFAALIGTDSYNEFGTFNLILLEFNNTGHLNNATQFDGSGDLIFADLVVNSEGDYIFSATNYEANSSVSNVVLAKIDPNGNIKFSKKITSETHIKSLSKLRLDNDDNIYVLGNFINSTIINHRVSLLKFNKDGDLISSVLYGAHDANDESLDMKFISNNYGIITGCSDTYSEGDEDVIAIAFKKNELAGTCGNEANFDITNITLNSSPVVPNISRVETDHLSTGLNIVPVTLDKNNRVCYTPTIAPSITPTITPTLEPTLTPTLEPTLSPTTTTTQSPTTTTTTTTTEESEESGASLEEGGNSNKKDSFENFMDDFGGGKNETENILLLSTEIFGVACVISLLGVGISCFCKKSPCFYKKNPWYKKRISSKENLEREMTEMTGKKNTKSGTVKQTDDLVTEMTKLSEKNCGQKTLASMKSCCSKCKRFSKGADGAFKVEEKEYI